MSARVRNKPTKEQVYLNNALLKMIMQIYKFNSYKKLAVMLDISDAWLAKVLKGTIPISSGLMIKMHEEADVSFEVLRKFVPKQTTVIKECKMKVKDIVYENGPAWVYRDKDRNCYTVFRCGVTHSTSDSAYPLNEDGLSIAKARVDYFAKRILNNVIKEK